VVEEQINPVRAYYTQVEELRDIEARIERLSSASYLLTKNYELNRNLAQVKKALNLALGIAYQELGKALYDHNNQTEESNDS
jgi:hypothetical protein